MHLEIIVGPGLCACGCGEQTLICMHTDGRRGVRKGEPLKFVKGHYPNAGPVEFWKRVPRLCGADACWEWQGLRDRKGYARWGQRLVSRLMFKHFNGPIPDGLFVLHRCDNPPCVNPAHLFLGTHADNMVDMVSKGRSVRTQAKLTDEDVRAIRRLLATGRLTKVEIGRRFAVSDTAVYNLARGYSYRTVT